MSLGDLIKRLPDIEERSRKWLNTSSFGSPIESEIVTQDVPELCEAVRVLVDALNRFPGSARLASAPPDLRWINLTANDIRSIRQLYDEEHYTEGQLCQIFNQNLYVIRGIVRKEIWKEER